MPRGAKPKPPGTTVTRHARTHEWQPAPGKGWQHGEETPPHPDGLMPQSVVAWELWFQSWWSSYWTPEDLPVLALTIGLYDSVLRNAIGPEKLTPYLDRLGITPKGRQDLRWTERVPDAPKAKDEKPTDEVAARRARLAERTA